MPLKGWAIHTDDPLERSRISQQLMDDDESLLILNTCQRFECYGSEIPSYVSGYVIEAWERRDAFERLARIAAGLESRILGELEILGQLRSAYKEFKSNNVHHRELDPIFQKAVSLGRKARRMSGIDQKLTSLSGLAARELISMVPDQAPIAVIGSGSIASSAARYLYKRGNSPLRIFSRCPERAVELATKLEGFGSGLDGLSDELKDVQGILCATSAPHPVLYLRHLNPDVPPCTIIDLGEPPDCDDEIKQLKTCTYLDLLDIEHRANVNSEYRKECAYKAGRIICDGASAWAELN